LSSYSRYPPDADKVINQAAGKIDCGLNVERQLVWDREWKDFRDFRQVSEGLFYQKEATVIWENRVKVKGERSMCSVGCIRWSGGSILVHRSKV